MKFEIGQEVLFTQPLFHKGQGLINGEVIKVGRKYVYVKSVREFKFDKKTLLEAGDSYNYEGRIYLSEQDYFDNIELSDNRMKIRKSISSKVSALTLEQTREILRIIGVE